MPASLITRLPANRRDEYLRRFSLNSRRLRSGYGANGALDLTKKGRSDTFKAVLSRAGIILIPVWQQVSMHGFIQANPAHRNQPTGETITVDAGPTTFSEDGAAVDYTFGATGQTDIAATSSFDAAATGKTRIYVS